MVWMQKGNFGMIESEEPEKGQLSEDLKCLLVHTGDFFPSMNHLYCHLVTSSQRQIHYKT